MASTSPTEILARLRTKKNYEDLGRGATEDEVSAIREALGVAIPPEYVEFLKTCGYAFWFGTCIFGVAPSKDDSVIYWTLKARNESLPRGFRPRPKDALVIHDYGGGGYYFLLDSGKPRAGQVVLVTDDALGGEVQSYDSFWSFLRIFV